MVNVEELFWEQMLKKELFPHCFFLNTNKKTINSWRKKKIPTNFFHLNVRWMVLYLWITEHQNIEIYSDFILHILSLLKNITNYI